MELSFIYVDLTPSKHADLSHQFLQFVHIFSDFSMIKLLYHIHKGSFFSFPIFYIFTFSCLNGHGNPYIVSDLRENTSNTLPLSIVPAVCFVSILSE